MNFIDTPLPLPREDIPAYSRVDGPVRLSTDIVFTVPNNWVGGSEVFARNTRSMTYNDIENRRYLGQQRGQLLYKDELPGDMPLPRVRPPDILEQAGNARRMDNRLFLSEI